MIAGREDDMGGPPFITVIVLAAGSSRRMAGAHKLLEELRGDTVLGHVLSAARGSGASRVLVVTGHQRDEVEAMLPSGVDTVHNPDFETGIASSLRAGLAALTELADGALVMLGDMPFVTEGNCATLIREFTPDSICVPVSGDRRGNPVLWPRRFFDEILRLEGDRGARGIMDRHPQSVREIQLEGSAVLFDIDVRADLIAARDL